MRYNENPQEKYVDLCKNSENNENDSKNNDSDIVISEKLSEFLAHIRETKINRCSLGDARTIVVDSGCSLSMLTRGRLKVIRKLMRFKYVVKPLDRERRFKTVGGGTVEAKWQVSVPVRGAGMINFAIAESDCVLTPPLLGGDWYMQHGAKIDYGKKNLSFGTNKVIPLSFSGTVPCIQISRKRTSDDVASMLARIETAQESLASRWGSDVVLACVTSLVQAQKQMQEHRGVSDRKREIVFVLDSEFGTEEALVAGEDIIPDIKEISEDPDKMRRLHQNCYHYTPEQLLARYNSLLPLGSSVRRNFISLARIIVDACKICGSRQKPGKRLRDGGLIAHRVNQLVTADTVSIQIKGRLRKCLHLMDVFSRFSLSIIGDQDAATTVRGLVCWKFIFGSLPSVLVTDNGTEFDNDNVRECTKVNMVELWHVPLYSPSSNGIVERGNSTLKYLVESLEAGDASHYDALTPSDILLEACCGKNGLTKRNGLSAHTIALGYPLHLGVPLESGASVDPLGKVDDFVVQRNLLRSKIRKTINDERLVTELRKRVMSDEQKYKSAEIEIGQKIEVNLPISYQKKQSLRRWEPAVVRGAKGAKVLVVQVLKTGGYQEVSRQNARPLKYHDEESDRLANTTKINERLRIEKFNPDDLVCEPVCQKMNEFEELVHNNIRLNRAIIKSMVAIRTNLLSPDFSLGRGSSVLDPALISGLREVVISLPNQNALVRDIGGATSIRRADTASPDPSVTSRLVIGFTRIGEWVYKDSGQPSRYLPRCDYMVTVFFGPVDLQTTAAQAVKPRRGRKPGLASTPGESPDRDLENLDLDSLDKSRVRAEEGGHPPSKEQPEARASAPVTDTEIGRQEQSLRDIDHDTLTDFEEPKRKQPVVTTLSNPKPLPDTVANKKRGRPPLSEEEKERRLREKQKERDTLKRLKVEASLKQKKDKSDKRQTQDNASESAKRRKILKEKGLYALLEHEMENCVFEAVLVEDGCSGQGETEYSLRYLETPYSAEETTFLVQDEEEEFAAFSASFSGDSALLEEAFTMQQAKRANDIPVSKALKRVDEWRVASEKEISGLLKFGVLRVIKRNDIPENATVLTSRWVATQKQTNKGESFLKLRLVARGFEQPFETLQESVTAKRETVRLLCCIAVQYGWQILSLDARQAFLQARLDETPRCDRRKQDIVVEPPAKGNPLQPSEVFQMDPNRTIYGTREAPQLWQNSLAFRLRKAGWKQSVYDLGLWYLMDDGELQGCIVLHVDDTFATGNGKAISNLKSLDVEWGEIDRNTFKFCGVDYALSDGVITASMAQYTDLLDELESVSGLNSRSETDALSPKEQTACRGLVGQLLWLSKHRPDICVLVNQAAQKVTSVMGARLANKCVRYLKAEKNDFDVKYEKLYCPSGTFQVVMCADAAFLPESANSQCGLISFLVGDEELCGNGCVRANLLRFASRLQRKRCKNPKNCRITSS